MTLVLIMRTASAVRRSRALIDSVKSRRRCGSIGIVWVLLRGRAGGHALLDRRADELDDRRRRLLHRAGVEGRLGVVFDGELDRARDVLAGQVGGEGEREVDAGRDAG